MIKLVSKFATNAVKPYSIIMKKQSTKVMGATATVRVRQGELRGAARALPAPAPAAAGEHYFSFKGIPYAQPPVGKHRFKAPAPPQPC
ncbi:PREDICTED: esterase B1-like [Papilio polytes]|uniref:esterase B1-like n=1 Tax=Papilio polytes TaxID=76194 RepID=UPI000676A847|nr:PREDICTED: esterase B1-like [Papilio polytes]